MGRREGVAQAVTTGVPVGVVMAGHVADALNRLVPTLRVTAAAAAAAAVGVRQEDVPLQSVTARLAPVGCVTRQSVVCLFVCLLETVHYKVSYTF